MDNMTVEEFAEYLNANEERVQELLSAFTIDDLSQQLNVRKSKESKGNGQIENNFKYHPPKDQETALAHGAVRNECKHLANTLDTLLPNSREKSLAMTKLEETMMWANAAIARNEITQ